MERQVTHKAVAKVARLMGYTTQGLKDLCLSCRVNSEWTTIGVTRTTSERVNARRIDGRYEFSVGSAFALTTSEVEAQRVRDQVAEAVVKRIKSSRPAISQSYIKANEDHPPVDEDHGTDGLSSPETMIISPVAPRDPRGLHGRQR